MIPRWMQSRSCLNFIPSIPSCRTWHPPAHPRNAFAGILGHNSWKCLKFVITNYLGVILPICMKFAFNRWQVGRMKHRYHSRPPSCCNPTLSRYFQLPAYDIGLRPVVDRCPWLVGRSIIIIITGMTSSQN